MNGLVIFVVTAVFALQGMTCWKLQPAVAPDGTAVMAKTRSALNTYEGDCQEGGPVPQCATDPCVGATCQENTEATCLTNICSGCTQIWFDDAGKEVESCSEE